MDVSFILDKDESHIHTGNETEGRRWLKVGTINKATNYEQWTIGNGQLIKGEKMDVLWIVNTNTFLLVFLIIMVSYLTAQVNMLIRWLKRD